MRKAAALFLFVLVLQFGAHAKVKMALWGDMYDSRATGTRNVVSVLRNDITDWDFMTHVGDFTLYGEKAHWEATLSYAPTKALFNSGKFLMCTSNHERKNDPSATNWNSFTAGVLPKNDATNSTKFYLKTYKGANETVHVFALDAYWGISTTQQNWLDSKLASLDPDDWIIGLWHPPSFDVTYKPPHGGTHAWLKSLCNSGGDFVFNGHAHQYVRTNVLGPTGTVNAKGDKDLVSSTDPGGIVHIVNGCAGASWSAPPPANPKIAQTLSERSFPLITFLEFDGNKVNVKTIDARPGSSLAVVDEWNWTQAWQSSNPGFHLTPTALHFSGVKGGLNPSPKPVTATAVNGLSLSGLTATSSKAWLKVNVSGTGTTRALSNVVNLNLATASDTAVVTVVAGGITKQYNVSLDLQTPPKPDLNLSPAALYFVGVQGGLNPSPKHATATAVNGLSLSGLSATSSRTWLKVNVSGTGLTRSLSNAVDLSVAKVSDSATVTVTADGVSKQYKVFLSLSTTSVPLLSSRAGGGVGITGVRVSEKSVEFIVRPPKPGSFRLSVCDVKGKSVWNYDGTAAQGAQRIAWNFQDETQGQKGKVYFAVLRQANRKSVCRFLAY